MPLFQRSLHEGGPGGQVLQPVGLGELRSLHLGGPGGKVLRTVLLSDDLGQFQELGGGAQSVEEFLEQFGGHVLLGIGEKAPVLVLPQRGDQVGLRKGAQEEEEFLELFGYHVPAGIGHAAQVLFHLKQGGETGRLVGGLSEHHCGSGRRGVGGLDEAGLVWLRQKNWARGGLFLCCFNVHWGRPAPPLARSALKLQHILKSLYIIEKQQMF